MASKFEWSHMIAQIRFVESYVRWPVIAFVARLACEVSGATMPPAAGTLRSDSVAAQCCA